MKPSDMKMNIDDLKDYPFKGFMDEEEARRLYELGREAGRMGPCLEIGSYCGRSAAYLGMGCRESGGVLYSIDHHRGSEEQQPGQEYFDPDLVNGETGQIDTLPLFRKTIAAFGLDDTVIPIVAKSAIVSAVWSTPLSLVFIDGGHTFEAALADYSGWVSHIMPGGFLVIHDIFPDPAKGGQAPYDIYRMALASGMFSELPMIKTMGVLRRAEERLQHRT
jgi:MMP 1-O-methyltransferase